MARRQRGDLERGLQLARAKVLAAGLDADLASEAIQTYGLALERAYLLRDAWDRLGQPALGAGSKGQPVPHPLIAAIEGAERHLAAADAALRPRSQPRGNTSGNRLGRPHAPDRAATVTPIRGKVP